MTRKKPLRRLKLVRDASIPKELRRARQFAEISKVAKRLQIPPSKIEVWYLFTSDK